MIWMIKLLGFALIFSACALIGTYKSLALKNREQRLLEIKGCFEELSARLLYDGSERTQLIESVFVGKGIVELENGIFKVTDCGISADDKKLLAEFLSAFGSADTKSEYERIKLYTSLTEKNLSNAASENSKLSRLYRTLGICFGAAVCLILL